MVIIQNAIGRDLGKLCSQFRGNCFDGELLGKLTLDTLTPDAEKDSADTARDGVTRL
jgi:hypothetical protein